MLVLDFLFYWLRGAILEGDVSSNESLVSMFGQWACLTERSGGERGKNQNLSYT